MNRREEILLNLTLLVAVLALGYLIWAGGSSGEDLTLAAPPVSSKSAKSSDAETAFNPETARKKYPNFGRVTVYQPILTPTPTPPPATPTPKKTPDIKLVLQNWRLSSASFGEATIEDKGQKDPSLQFFTLKIGEARRLNITKDETANATLVKLDENAENPYAIFSLEGTNVQYMLKMF